MSDKSVEILDDQWLVEMHEQWKGGGRVASPENVGALLDKTAQQWLAEEEDRQLVADARQGDDRAWSRLIQKYGPRVRHIAWSILGDSPITEDVVVECFAELAVQRERLRPEEGLQRLIVWIAKRRSLTAAARAKRQRDAHGAISLEAALEDNLGVSLPLVDETADPEELVIRKLIGMTVRAAVDQLPVSLRSTVDYCYFGGLSYAQAGVLLGISKSAVQQRLRKAEGMLKHWLGEVLGESAFVRKEDGE